MRVFEDGDMLAHRIGMNCLLAVVAAMALALAGGGGAAAADGDKKPGRERELARRVQQLQQEKGELSGKLKELGDKSEELNQAIDRARRDAAKALRELAASKKESAERAAELAAKAEAFATERKDLKRRLEETTTRLAQRENEKRKLEEVAAVQVEAMGRQGLLIESCRSDNAKLYQYGDELLQKLKSEGRRSRYSLTGLGEVDSFNVYQDYRDKLDKLRIEPPRAPQ